MMISREFVLFETKRIGFSLCGIAPARKLGEHAAHFSRWLDAGMESGMEYMRRNADVRLDPSRLVAEAKSVIVCGVHYKNEAWDQTQRGVAPKIASYMYMEDYHSLMKGMLRQLLESIRRRYPHAQGRCFSDAVPMLEKVWAVEAGLGWRGKNSLLLTPDYGSFVILGEVVLDAACDSYDRPYTGNGCGDCTLCMDSCPNRAIVAPGVIDTGRCIARLTTERMPEGAGVDRSMLHGWLAGCDECQSCCPHNQRAPYYTNPSFRPVIDPERITPEFWGNLSREEFSRLLGKTPLARPGYDSVMANLPVDPTASK